MVRLGKSTDRQRETSKQITDGIISNVTVGYTIIRMDETEAKIDGVSVFRVRTFPQEISLIYTSANKSVEIGRTQDSTIAQFRSKVQVEKVVEINCLVFTMKISHADMVLPS